LTLAPAELKGVTRPLPARTGIKDEKKGRRG
jgi:hypothetical protein